MFVLHFKCCYFCHNVIWWDYSIWDIQYVKYWSNKKTDTVKKKKNSPDSLEVFVRGNTHIFLCVSDKSSLTTTAESFVWVTVTPTSYWTRWTVLSLMGWLWIRGSVIIDVSHVVRKAAEKHLPVLVGWLTTPVITDPISLLRYSLPCFSAGASPAWFCKVRLRGLL